VQDIYAVSPEKIQEMAKKYIRLDDMFVMIVGDGEKVQPQIKDDNPLNLLPK
jgi:predicted Zn-dependent peptidase